MARVGKRKHTNGNGRSSKRAKLSRAVTALQRAFRGRRKRGFKARQSKTPRTYQSRRHKSSGTFAFPDVKMVQTRWCDYHTLNTGSLGGSENSPAIMYKWAWNDLYKPDPTNSDHAASYFNAYGRIWKQFTVVGAAISVKIAWVNNSEDVDVMMGIVEGPTGFAVGPGQFSYDAMREQQFSGFSGFKRLRATTTQSESGTPAVMVSSNPIRYIWCSKKVSLRKTFDIPKKDGILAYADSHELTGTFALAGAAGASPAAPRFLYLIGFPIRNSNFSALGNISLEVTLKQSVVMDSLRERAPDDPTA